MACPVLECGQGERRPMAGVLDNKAIVVSSVSA